MSSTINTSGVNISYPTPGQNNNSQTFRDNWTAIKTALDSAATEITEIQNKAILKSALVGTTLMNDMAGAVISNTLAQSFTKPMYNLGGSLTGIVVVNYLMGDVQFGSITGDITLQFTNWCSAGQQGQIELQFTILAPTAVITFPTEVSLGLETIENSNTVMSTVSVPAGVAKMSFLLQTVDCGTTITISPIIRPRKATAIQERTPLTSLGLQGDQAGTISADSNYLYICTAAYDGATNIWKRIALPAATW